MWSSCTLIHNTNLTTDPYDANTTLADVPEGFYKLPLRLHVDDYPHLAVVSQRMMTESFKWPLPIFQRKDKYHIPPASGWACSPTVTGADDHVRALTLNSGV